MPQMNKGGKFIFGKSLIRTDGTLRIPPQAMEEYHIADEGKVYLFTGSKITGGFCVTRKGLLHPSKLGHILGFFRNYPLLLLYPMYLNFASSNCLPHLPYIVRFIIFNLLLVPSTNPLL